MLHVPYKGGAPALTDVLAASRCVLFDLVLDQPHVSAGRLVILASSGLTRPSFLPNVPTVAESGYPGFNATNWYAFVAPAKTPTAVLMRWNQELVKALVAGRSKPSCSRAPACWPAGFAARAGHHCLERIAVLGQADPRAQDHSGLTAVGSWQEPLRGASDSSAVLLKAIIGTGRGFEHDGRP